MVATCCLPQHACWCVVLRRLNPVLMFGNNWWIFSILLGYSFYLFNSFFLYSLLLLFATITKKASMWRMIKLSKTRSTDASTTALAMWAMFMFTMHTSISLGFSFIYTILLCVIDFNQILNFSLKLLDLFLQLLIICIDRTT